ncbi:MAG: dTDP-glucose 4,6-dehydratase [Dehalococcoidales bacterium]|nr:dTDP-glucose 4,6-dehydratase [Dehalococcoidales bacterium]
MRRILVTGGAGFIGSNYVHYLLQAHPDYQVIVYDKLTYAGNLDNLKDLEGNPRYQFVHGDICDAALVEKTCEGVSAIVNFAAETHVDRSLLEPGAFINTDVYGTYVLLEAVKKLGIERYVQISTDEVYGSVEVGSSLETDPLAPRSPYAASKAAGDMMVNAYRVSFGLPTLITRASNNFGPYQYPEKVIPLFVTNALEDRPLPLYGDGLNVRDWLFVADHCEGIDVVLHEGQLGEVYNIGGGNERTNIEITGMILELLGKPKTLIKYVADRPGHDRRYSLDCSKLQALGWTPRHRFEEAMAATVKWYVENEWWWKKIKSGEYAEYYKKNYGYRVTT